MKQTALKSELLAKCFEYIANRKERILSVIADIKESLNDEEKSTVGDKHHVTRAMLQIEQENSGRQLHQVEKLEDTLHKISLDHQSDIVHLGSLVHTTQASYFISVSAGAMEVGKETIYCVSVESPIGSLLLGKRAGEKIVWNDKEITIQEIF